MNNQSQPSESFTQHPSADPTPDGASHSLSDCLQYLLFQRLVAFPVLHDDVGHLQVHVSEQQGSDLVEGKAGIL